MIKKGVYEASCVELFSVACVGLVWLQIPNHFLPTHPDHDRAASWVVGLGLELILPDPSAPPKAACGRGFAGE